MSTLKGSSLYIYFFPSFCFGFSHLPLLLSSLQDVWRLSQYPGYEKWLWCELRPLYWCGVFCIHTYARHTLSCTSLWRRLNADAREGLGGVGKGWEGDRERKKREWGWFNVFFYCFGLSRVFYRLLLSINVCLRETEVLDYNNFAIEVRRRLCIILDLIIQNMSRKWRNTRIIRQEIKRKSTINSNHTSLNTIILFTYFSSLARQLIWDKQEENTDDDE